MIRRVALIKEGFQCTESKTAMNPMNKDRPSFVCYFFLHTCYGTDMYYFLGFDALGEIWHCRNDCCCHFKCSVFVVTWK